jgi:SAM-dependent methyltransferase
MDNTTLNVRCMSNAYPYPDANTQVRMDAFPSLLLSYLDRPAMSRPLRILDAGCGTCAGTVAVAALNPEAEVVAMDISSEALSIAKARAEQEGVDNLQFIEGDILDPHHLPCSDQGYDVIHASGVLHHLSEPRKGLAHLSQLLSPDGVMVIMVYGTYGRQPVNRFSRVTNMLCPEKSQFDIRLKTANDLLDVLDETAVTHPYWKDGAPISDSEMVDRYLHVNAVDFKVSEVFEMLKESRLEFLRWLEPRAWCPAYRMPPGPARDRIKALTGLQRYSIMELLYNYPQLDFVACKEGARLRPSIEIESLWKSTVEWNPQACLRNSIRRSGEQVWIDDTEVTVRGYPPYRFSGIYAALVHAYVHPASAAELISNASTIIATNESDALTALFELIQKEVFFLPETMKGEKQ